MKFQKINSPILFLVLVILFPLFISSCLDNEDGGSQNIKKEKISGFVQKGPFVNGTTVQMNELNDGLLQTGKVFSSQILDNSGNFEITSVELSSSFVGFTANGFYFNEVEGKLSNSQITLNAISDIKDINTINVNLLTHLEKRRVEFLVSEGKPFIEAKKKAQEEVLGIFSFTLPGNSISESLDISKNSDGNAMLLAISVILQGQRSEGQLSELLATISSDIEKDGVLNNQQLLNQLRESAVGLDLEDIRKNLINRFTSLGIQATISPFETYVNKFLSFTAKEPGLGEISIVEKTSNLASFRVFVNPNGSPTTVKVFYGETKESLGTAVILTGSPIDGNIPVQVSGQISGLKRVTTYFYKISAENSKGKLESQILEFETSPELATLTTKDVFEITATSAKSGGTITNNGGGELIETGVVWGLTQNPTIENSKNVSNQTSTSFSVEFSELSPSKTYYVRAFAKSEAGIAYGNEVSFSTRDGIAKLITLAIFDVKAKSARSGGSISDDGGSQILDKGVVWSTNQSPTLNDNKTSSGNGKEEYTSNLTNLLPGKNYYLRAYATTISGSFYGNEVSFKTNDGIFNDNLSYGSVSDIDGNSYKTIKIGNQIWMAENLRTTKYNSGAPISVLTTSSIFSGIDGLFNYEKNEDFIKYGRLYNGYAASKGNLCPIGWHVPSRDEFIELFISVGGNEGSVNFNLLRSAGGWEDAGNEQTNLSGLSLSPSGRFEANGQGNFQYVGTQTYLWTFTNSSSVNFPGDALTSGLGLSFAGWIYTGLCVRCVKD